MWNRIASLIRQVMAKLNLIKRIGSLSDLKDVDINDQFYDKIAVWKQLYAGYYSDWHDIEYKTISGMKQRKMMTLGMPKVVAQEMASLVFNEKCEISISDQGLNDEIQAIFDQNNFNKQFQRYLEYDFGLGGMVVKVHAEDQKIKLSYVAADSFIPIQWDNKGVYGGVFVNQFKRGEKHYTHLEWQMWQGNQYLIKNEVYESGNGQDLGMKVNLQQFFPDLLDELSIGGLKRSLFVYFKPNTANNVDMTSPLGISIYANALDTLHMLDKAYDSFMTEFKYGKKRIIIPAQFIKTVVDPQTGDRHRYFDPEDEVYEAFNFAQDSDEVKDISVELRVSEHIEAINALLNILAMQIGFSAGAFTFDGQSVKTATEVVSENSKTFRTKKGHETLVEAGIQELIEVIVQVGELYGILSRPSGDYEVLVSFDDSIVEDRGTEITQQVQMVSNRLQSRLRAIMKIHEVTEDEAQRIIEEINAENKTADAQAVDFFGGTGG